MENSYKYFENHGCKYYPCHKNVENINCMFCYCPMYGEKNCPGNPKFIESKGKIIKDCSDCLFPHIPENYDKIMEYLRNIIFEKS